MGAANDLLIRAVKAKNTICTLHSYALGAPRQRAQGERGMTHMQLTKKGTPGLAST